MRPAGFGPVTGVPTSIPAFAGYTAKAEVDGEAALLLPVEIARTLGLGEYRYVPVRRLLIYVEQSVDRWLEQLVFEPNDATTWTEVVAKTSDFPHNLWRQGALPGIEIVA